MKLQRPSLNVSFRTKVLVPVVACMIGIIAVTFFVVDHRFTEQSETESRNILATANATFRNLQRDRAENLVQRFRTLPNDTRVRAAFVKADAQKIGRAHV